MYYAYSFGIILFIVLSIGSLFSIFYCIYYTREKDSYFYKKSAQDFNNNLFNYRLSCVFFSIFVFLLIFCFFSQQNISQKSNKHISGDPILGAYYGHRSFFDLSKYYQNKLIIPLKYENTLDPEKVSSLLEKVINRYTNSQYYVVVTSYKPEIISKNSDIRTESWFHEKHDKQSREQDYVYYKISIRIIGTNDNVPTHFSQL